MKKIRQGVFETNSSSTHSLVIVAEEDYDAWRTGNGDILLDRYNGVMISRADAIARIRKDNPRRYGKVDFTDREEADDILGDHDFQTFDGYQRDTDMEQFEQRHTTKGGDKVVAFGYYGYDS